MELPSFSSSFFREAGSDTEEADSLLQLANLYIDEMSGFLRITPEVEDLITVIQSCLSSLDRPLESLEASELESWGDAGYCAAKQVLERRGLRIFVPLHISFLASCGAIDG